jgi:hypothetical protein
VPKKTKDPKKQNGAASTQTASGLTAQPGTSKPKSAKRRSPKQTRKISAPRKKPSAKADQKVEGRPEPSSDEINQRAYFISERRAQLLLPADPSADWLEARRQLFAEAGIRVS